MSRALIVLANGFEEIEAIAIMDILRRADIQVTLAGLDSLHLTAAHDLKVTADTLLADALRTPYDAIILPGGEPGTTNLENSTRVREALRKFYDSGKIVAAICAAPRILDGIGLLDGKRATSYPGTKPRMQRCEYRDESVVTDGRIITSRGPGTAMAFAYALVAALKSPTLSEHLQKNMVFA